MAQTKTYNSYLADKVALRVDHLPKGRELYVLDCFAGKGLIWSAVRELTGRKITTLPIDMNQDSGFRLPGDNRAYLDTMDLDPFQVIDLDAYGIPYDQLKIIFEREYVGAVFVTFIQAINQNLPLGMLQELGFHKDMIKSIPTLFSKKGWGYFLEWLALRGVDQIWHRSHGQKHYLFFQAR